MSGLALQVTSTGTSTEAPPPTGCAGELTWTSRNSPPEKNAAAGPVVANSASTLPKMIATTAAARVYTLGRKGHDPPIYVAMPEFLGSGIRATVVGWKRVSSGHR